MDVEGGKEELEESEDTESEDTEDTGDTGDESSESSDSSSGELITLENNEEAINEYLKPRLTKIEARKKYQSSEERKKKRREYEQRENCKKRRSLYNKRPEVIERQKQYYKRPDVIERRKKNLAIRNANKKILFDMLKNGLLYVVKNGDFHQLPNNINKLNNE